MLPGLIQSILERERKKKKKKKKELISRDPDHPDMNSAFILLNSSLWRAFCL